MMILRYLASPRRRPKPRPKLKQKIIRPPETNTSSPPPAVSWLYSLASSSEKNKNSLHRKAASGRPRVGRRGIALIPQLEGIRCRNISAPGRATPELPGQHAPGRISSTCSSGLAERSVGRGNQQRLAQDTA